MADKPPGFDKFDSLMKKLVKVPPKAVERKPMTKAQRIVLERLATGKWCMDRYGRAEMGAIMMGPEKAEAVVSAKTVSWLYQQGYIAPQVNSVTDWDITKEGRAAIA